MKKLINAAEAAVDDLLEGYVAAMPSLSILRDHKVVVRTDFAAFRESGKVALISGGGSGHEPAHAGYVGRGMLTAAVCGEIFTSPSTDAILAALRTVTGPAGALLIVKNYTGDRLNFGLAAQIARSEGFRVEMVIVGDDVALNDVQTAGRRGIAGTVLVHKVAGASAEAGLSLAEVRDAARDAAANVATMGVALRPCVVPGTTRPSFDLAADEIEYGLGIHGESGRSREPIASAAEIAERLCMAVFTDLGLKPGEAVALMVNNLGATPPMELSIMAKEAVQATRRRGLIIERLWVGTYLTALDMAGCSITVMRMTPTGATALDAPCEIGAWPGPGRADGSVRRTLAVKAPAAKDRPARTPASPKLRRALAEVTRMIRESEARLTELDRAAGDGDLGINLARGAVAIEQDLDTVAGQHPAYAFQDLSAIVRRTVGGTSGALYAAGLLQAAVALGEREEPTAADWAEALEAGTMAISRLGDAKVGDQTMLDALIPAAEALRASVADRHDDPLGAAIAAAEQGCAATAAITAQRGRASYVGDRAIGTPDPGAEAVAVWLRAIHDALL